MTNLYLNNHMQPPPQALEKSLESNFNFKKAMNHFLNDLDETEQITEITESTETNLKKLKKEVKNINNSFKTTNDLIVIKNKIRKLIESIKRNNKESINFIIPIIEEINSTNIEIINLKSQLLIALKS